MTVAELEDVRSRIEARGFIPRRLVELLCAIMGDFGAAQTGKELRNLHTKDYKWKSRTCRLSNNGGSRYGARPCWECGEIIPRNAHLCPSCGEDNTFAFDFGLTKKKKNKEQHE